MLIIRDLTQDLQLQYVTHKNDLLNKLTASVSHEMITPIKCIITYAQNLLKRLHNEDDSKMIFCVLRTAQMLQ